MGGEDSPKGLAEFGVENGVNDGVKGRIGVTQPGEEFESHPRNTGLAEGGYNVDAEEWHPAEEESAHDDADSYGGFVVGDVVRGRVGVYRRGEGRGGERSGHCLNALYVLLSVAVETGVDAEHDNAGYIEGDTGGHDGVGGREVEGAGRVLVLPLVDEERTFRRPVESQ